MITILVWAGSLVQDKQNLLAEGIRKISTIENKQGLDSSVGST
jgi:hypothetical protein